MSQTQALVELWLIPNVANIVMSYGAVSRKHFYRMPVNNRCAGCNSDVITRFSTVKECMGCLTCAMFGYVFGFGCSRAATHEYVEVRCYSELRPGVCRKCNEKIIKVWRGCRSAICYRCRTALWKDSENWDDCSAVQKLKRSRMKILRPIGHARNVRASSRRKLIRLLKPLITQDDFS
jgi:hypothetical protein